MSPRAQIDTSETDVRERAETGAKQELRFAKRP